MVSMKWLREKTDKGKAFARIRELADLEWNGMITIVEFRDRINDIISVISKKESK